jgi:hypothetical protein
MGNKSDLQNFGVSLMEGMSSKEKGVGFGKISGVRWEGRGVRPSLLHPSLQVSPFLPLSTSFELLNEGKNKLQSSRF